MEFKEFEEVLKDTIKKFRNKNKFSLIGIAGSLNMLKDLDMIIFPKKTTKKGEFLKLLCEFLELLKINIKERKSDIIVITYSFLEEEVKYLSGGKIGKDIFLHISSFPDIDMTSKQVVESYLKNIQIYYGDTGVLDIPITNKDYYYNYLFIINCLYSNYPKELEIKKIHERVSYILKHNGIKSNFDEKTTKQIYFEVCDSLDSTAK